MICLQNNLGENRMLKFFNKKDPWGNGLSVWVLAALLFATPFIITTLKQVEMKNEVEAWLPERDPQAVLLDWYGENFPVKDRLFVSWDDSTLNDARTELLAARLEGYVDSKGVERRGSPYVEDVLTPRESLRQILDQGIEDDQALKTLGGLLLGHGALKVKLTELGHEKQEFIEQEIVRRAQEELNLNVEIIPAVKQWQPSLKFSEFAEIRQKKADTEEFYEEDEERLDTILEVPEHDFQVTWHLITPDADLTTQVQTLIESITSRPSRAYPNGDPLIAETFFSTGAPISLVVTFTEAGQADRSAALADVAAVAKDSFIPEEAFHMGGRPVGSARLNEEVAKSNYDPDAPIYMRSVVGTSALVSFLLAFLMLRSFRLGILVLTVSGYATLFTVMLVPLTGSSMNMVLIVMPTLLSVLTLSGAIHLASYWKHAAWEDPQNAVIKAVKMAAQPCILASATTAIGLASLMTSTLNPVRDFGIYAATGCIISLVFVLFVLPALMQLWPGKPPEEHESDGKYWRLLADGLYRYSSLVTIVCLGLFAFGLYGLTYFKSETKVIRYFPEDAPIMRDYWFLEDNVIGINTVDTVVRFDQAAQENMQFLERLEVVRQITEKIRAHHEITGALSLADFQEPTEPPAEDASFLVKARYNKRSNAFEDKIKEGELPEAESLLTVAKTDADWTVPGDKKLSETGDELWRVSAQAYVMADNDYGQLMNELDEISQSVLKFHAGTHHVVTGMVPVFLRTQEALLESLIRSFGMAFAIIAVVLIAVLKNPIAGLLTMLPNLMPVAFCFGTLSIMGQRVDIGTMITASVALGIAVDGTLHLLTWFKQGIILGKTRKEAIELGLSHCAPAMWQTSAIVAIGLLMLFPAPLLMISRFGILMAALIAAALIADIVFLPALLAGWLGTIIENSVKKASQTGKNSDLTNSRQSAESNEEAELEAPESRQSSLSTPHLKVVTAKATESSNSN
ncbi:MMPL family transporter [Rubinisphaera sp.]|uniref:efflux RND transporter permease subunit n=1 Tax=Rubinisphaera sp. TaxID=2024857 RepID=UPI0025D810DE|nr:MMPL family transporter [Rubinisphaera sp.]